ncbi:MAG: hypothetical protein OXT05_13270, partial [Chloroflexota bacterium]|nr:hypothetical protein [Chloroflexota bacterium]
MQFLCVLLSFVVKMNFNRLRYTTRAVCPGQLHQIEMALKSTTFPATFVICRGDSVNRPCNLGYLRGRYTAARRHCGPVAPPFSFIFVAIGAK